MRFEKVSYSAFNKDMVRYGFDPGQIYPAYKNIVIPKRKTKHSAGYDFVTPVSFVLSPYETMIIPTGIKVYFEPEEAKRWHLALYIRSSIGIKRGIVMANQTGVIDSDYYNNIDNEGDMLIAIKNTNNCHVGFKAGDRLIQGIFQMHGITSDDEASGERIGGVGSTNKQSV